MKFVFIVVAVLSSIGPIYAAQMQQKGHPQQFTIGTEKDHVRSLSDFFKNLQTRDDKKVEGQQDTDERKRARTFAKEHPGFVGDRRREIIQLLGLDEKERQLASISRRLFQASFPVHLVKFIREDALLLLQLLKTHPADVFSGIEFQSVDISKMPLSQIAELLRSSIAEQLFSKAGIENGEVKFKIAVLLDALPRISEKSDEYAIIFAFNLAALNIYTEMHLQLTMHLSENYKSYLGADFKADRDELLDLGRKIQEENFTGFAKKILRQYPKASDRKDFVDKKLVTKKSLDEFRKHRSFLLRTFFYRQMVKKGYSPHLFNLATQVEFSIKNELYSSIIRTVHTQFFVKIMKVKFNQYKDADKMLALGLVDKKRG